jgi:hypothetical protein
MLGPRAWTFRRVWLAGFVGIASLTVLWSLATPLAASPDEPAQLIRAAAIVRGQWIGGRQGVPADEPAVSLVRVPATIADLGSYTECYEFKVDVPAGCTPPTPTSIALTPVQTYVGHYPPLYYLVVGWPSRLVTSGAAVELMDLVSALLTAMLLALALATAWRWGRSRWATVGVCVAATPMVLFLAGTVNPSSLEISAAICMWTAATVMIADHVEDPPHGLIVVLAVSTILTVLSRPVSLLWPAVLVVTLAPLAWGRFRWRALLARGDVRVGGALSVLAVVAAAAWVILAHGLDVVPTNVVAPGTAETTIIGDVMAKTGFLAEQTVGVFGFVDTPAPRITLVIWSGLTAAAFLWAIATSRGRAAVSLILTAVAALVVPWALIIADARTNGVLGQGRYFLPLLVAVPILAGVTARVRRRDVEQTGQGRRWPGWARFGVLACLAVGQVAAYAWALHRYLVGENGPLWPSTQVPDGWTPPVSGVILDLSFMVASIAFVVLVRSLSAHPASAPGAGDQTPASPVVVRT